MRAHSRLWTEPLQIMAAVAALACTPLEGGDDKFASPPASSAGIGGVDENQAGNGATAGRGEVSGGSGGTNGGGASGTSGRAACKAPELRSEILVPDVAGEDFEISADTTWSCEYDYVLNGRVLVGNGASLSIEAGTLIRAAQNSLLMVQRGGRIEANGTTEQPIVFTSQKPIGERKPGDYRGLVLIGDAATHQTNIPVSGTTADFRAYYGGGPTADASGSCGTLRFVRIEFAGGDLNEDSVPGAGLTFAGCGSGTIVEHVQVHRATDGVGLIGGSVPLRHVLVTNNARGDCFEWTEGYTGNMQFVIAQSLGAGRGLVGSNSETSPHAEPKAKPAIYNATLVGSPPLVNGTHFGLLLQFGSGVKLRNSIIYGFDDAAIDLRMPPGTEDEIGPDKLVDVSHALLFANRAEYTPNANKLGSMQGMRAKDPMLTGALERKAPNFRPGSDTTRIDVEPAPPPYDATADTRGAVAFEGADWTSGWTAYPEN